MKTSTRTGIAIITFIMISVVLLGMSRAYQMYDETKRINAYETLKHELNFLIMQREMMFLLESLDDEEIDVVEYRNV